MASASFAHTSPREVIIREGLAEIVVPNPDLYKRPNGKLEPAWMPVFYNPDAIVSRDLTVLLLKSMYKNREFFFVDTLAGTGVRGIRIALEASGSGIVNDIDPRAYYYIRKNIALNKLQNRVEPYHCEANMLLNNIVLSGMYVDYIDIDPYGSPAPFIDSALKPIGKEAFLGITATDVAPLSCTYPHKALSRYWSTCIKVDFEKELATRLLIANTALRASALEVKLYPLLAIAYKHYIRVFFKAERSARGAFDVVSNCIGYLWYCKSTLERGFTRTLEEATSILCLDGSKPHVIEKVWICPMHDPGLVESLVKLLGDTPWISRDTSTLLNILLEESKIEVPYYRLDKLCSVAKVSMPKLSTLLEELRARGIKCSRTHMDKRGIRVAASHSEFIEILRRIAQK